eukprot:Tbor_TRINITY_DN5760_c1_g2::TRINITY_DN5760_c1_g2_i8::g.20006::m.20006/K12876/RBM8A, Y14; RNA-binding protein 8A
MTDSTVTLPTRERGRGTLSDNQEITDIVRRVSRNRGGDYEMLSILDGEKPGDAAHSIEGWTLLVTGLPEETQENDILDVFGAIGDVRNTKIGLGKQNYTCIGYAIVQFSNRFDAEEACNKLNGTKFLTSSSITVGNAFVVPELSEIEDVSCKKRGREVNGDNDQREEENEDNEEMPM